MGGILELHTGDDEVTRSATVKIKREQFKGPLVNLVSLVIDRKYVFLATKNRAGDVAVGDGKTWEIGKLSF